MSNKKMNANNQSIIINNKKIRHEYFIEKEFESGISLYGWEVKSLRLKQVNINNAYVIFKNREAYLSGSVFYPLANVASDYVFLSKRDRKLLLNKREIDTLYGWANHKSCTVVVLLLYWKKIWVKVKIGVAKGKKKHDKRESIKEREWLINKNRLTKYFSNNKS